MTNINQKKLSATVQITPLTEEQQRWGLKGALEALTLITRPNNPKDPKELLQVVKNQLEQLDRK